MIDAILKYILYCYIIFTTNLIILIMSDGNRAEWSTGVILQEIEITSALTPKLYDTKSYYFVFATFAPKCKVICKRDMRGISPSLYPPIHSQRTATTPVTSLALFQ